MVTVQLKSGSNVNLSLHSTQRKINAIRGNLPDEVEESSLSDFRISDLPVMTIGATAKMDETVFFDLMDREIKPMPERIPGVGNVNLTGGQEREIQINLNSERMSAYNLSILEVSQTLLISNWKN